MIFIASGVLITVGEAQSVYNGTCWVQSRRPAFNMLEFKGLSPWLSVWETNIPRQSYICSAVDQSALGSCRIDISHSRMVIVATSPMSQEVSGHEANNSTDETIDDVLTFW